MSHRIAVADFSSVVFSMNAMLILERLGVHS